MDLATLNVRVEAGAAIRETEKLAAGLGKLREHGQALPPIMGRTTSELRKLQVAEAAAYREAERLATANQKATQATASLGVAGQTTARAMTYLGTAIGAAGVIRGVTVLAGYADTAKLLTARLSLVTDGSTDLARVQDALFASAQRTRTSYEAVAGLYTRVARNAAALGATQQDLLRFTEVVSMQLQVSGASATEAASGVQQLAQALAKGKLDGDEFRTIMEAMPTVADALAASLGVTKGALYDLSAQGKLTGREIVTAMLAVEAQTRTAFAALPPTIGQAFVTMKNDILRTVGELDARLGASTLFAGLISRLPQGVGFATNVLTGGAARMAGLTGGGGDSDGPTNVTWRSPAGVAGPDPEVQAAKDRRTAWEESRRLAAERARWEEEAILRAVRLAQARTLAELPAAARGTTTLQSRTFGVTRLPAGGLTPTTPRMTNARGDAQFAAYEEAKAAMEQSAALAEQLTENFTRSVQGHFATLFRDIFAGGRSAFQHFLDGFKGAVLNTVAELASKRLMESVFGGASGVGGLGALLSSPLAIGAGVGALVFGAIGRRSGPSYGANNTPRYDANGMDARQVAAREWLAAQQGTNNAPVRASVAGALTENTATRLFATFDAIRRATERGAAAAERMEARLAAGVGAASDLTIDRVLGARSQSLRLASGVAVVA